MTQREKAPFVSFFNKKEYFCADQMCKLMNRKLITLALLAAITLVSVAAKPVKAGGIYGTAQQPMAGLHNYYVGNG